MQCVVGLKARYMNNIMYYNKSVRFDTQMVFPYYPKCIIHDADIYQFTDLSTYTYVHVQ